MNFFERTSFGKPRDDRAAFGMETSGSRLRDNTFGMHDDRESRSYEREENRREKPRKVHVNAKFVMKSQVVQGSDVRSRLSNI